MGQFSVSRHTNLLGVNRQHAVSPSELFTQCIYTLIEMLLYIPFLPLLYLVHSMQNVCLSLDVTCPRKYTPNLLPRLGQASSCLTPTSLCFPLLDYFSVIYLSAYISICLPFYSLCSLRASPMLYSSLSL